MTDQSVPIELFSENGEPLCNECAQLYAPELEEFARRFFQGSVSQNMKLRDEVINAVLSFPELESAIKDMSNKDQRLLESRIYKLLQNKEYSNDVPF